MHQSHTDEIPISPTLPPEPEQQISIWVYTKDDNFIPVKLIMKDSDKIEAIKEFVEKKHGIPAKRQSLSSLGMKLDDDKTLLDYNIRKGSIIDDITF